MVSSAIPIITFRYYPYKRKKLTFWVSLFLSGKVPCKVSGGSSDTYVDGKRCKYWPVFTPFGPKLTFRVKKGGFYHRFGHLA